MCGLQKVRARLPHGGGRDTGNQRRRVYPLREVPGDLPHRGDFIGVSGRERESGEGREARMTGRELLEMQLGCVFTYQDGRMAYLNEPWGQTVPAPLLHVGKTLDGEVVYRLGQRADSAFVEKAQALLSRGVEDIAGYQREFRANHCTQEVCFYYPSPEGPEEGEARVLTAEDGPLLALTFEEDVEELPTATPFVGRVWEGRVVSVCRSVRKGRGHEAGIETLPEYRRQGHALAALRGWTGEVLRQGALPLYSAARENVASLALAEQAGYVPYAYGFDIW